MIENRQLETFIKKADIAALPVLPHTLQALKAALEKPSFNYTHLDNIIQYDPACMINLLAYANREMNNDFDKEISRVEHAAMFLGMERLEQFIENVNSLYRVKDIKVADKLARLLHRGVHAAYQAQGFAQLIDDSSVDEIYTSTLVTPISELLCWYLDPIKAQTVELLVYKQQKPYEEAQREIFGFSYHELAESLTHQWKIPHLFLQRQEMQDLESASKTIKCMYLAEKLSIIAEQGWYYDDMYEHISLCANEFHYSEARIAKEVHSTAVYMAYNAEEFFPVQSTCAYLALLPGKVPYSQIIAIEDKKPVVKKKPAVISKVAVEEKTETTKSPQVPSINLIHSANDFPSLIRITMDAFFETKFFSRVGFMMLSKDKKHLQFRSLRGKDNKKLTQSILPTKPDNLFSKLLVKPQTIFINTLNYNKFSPIINQTMKDMLEVEEFIAKSIHVNAKPIGLFYMDKYRGSDKDEAQSNPPMAVEDFNQMKKIAALFDKQLKAIH
ncbi:HDOD domain-containing protein [sulfur-oxidizing endosymbiont of Gigantopelta aegis]|uniref:HDOD domain-containing protein n=1 Tax=sulfur-oxidizing endosymbiont of Gigantopelta aegis TaxID=2794934 RepID=UPI001BE4CB60|nr:HDOD domain-containing protein [sulfur-oxidizing endosymbiont of Gigantopelta aegis]